MRYLLSIALGILLATAIYLGLFLASLGRPATETTILLLSKYRYKEALAEKLDSPKIVIVSGSNGLYGISARMIEETTGVATLNLATQVQVSLDYLLTKAKHHLHPGDIVILPLEFEFYWRKDETTDVFSDYVLGGDPAYLRTLPWRDRLWIFASASFTDISRRILLGGASLRDVEKTVASMPEHMNDRGDLMEHFKSAQTPADLAEVRNSKPRTTAFKWRRMQRPEFWAQIEAFAGWCHAHDVLCLATFPSTIHFDEYERKNARETADKVIDAYTARGVGVLGTPYDFMMPPENFFNSSYHLTLEASKTRTQKLVDLLEPELKRWQSVHP